jgi:hypothetical protein
MPIARTGTGSVGWQVDEWPRQFAGGVDRISHECIAPYRENTLFLLQNTSIASKKAS